MLNGRIYRAAFVPLLFALAIVAFSLADRPRPLTATLAPDAFDGARALEEARSLAARFPARRPGSHGDEALAAYVEQALRALGGPAGGGFQVHVGAARRQTIDGPRTLRTIVAERPGSGGGKPIVILAHRDAAARGALAELSATAALLELARVFAASETQRSVILVSTSGGSGGAAGARDFAAHLPGSPDAALVLGDLAGARSGRPCVVPFSTGLGSAPLRLQRTVVAALARETGEDPGAPSALGQLAHLILPIAPGEQGPLQAAGVPAVLVQGSGERAPPASDPVSAARLQGFGRGVLSAVYALDAGPDVTAGAPARETGLLIERKLLPEWAVRLLLAALFLPPLLVTIDGLARLRRRRERVGRQVLWVLACSLPFLLAVIFTRLLGYTGTIAAPPGPVLAEALPGGAAALEATLAAALVLALAWLAWPRTLRAVHLAPRPRTDAAGVALMLVLLALALVVWALNPFAALLLVLPLNLWLLLVSTDWRAAGGPLQRAAPLALVAVSAAPLLLLAAFYATRLGYGPGELLRALTLLVAGGYPGLLGGLLWVLALGCLAAATLLALRPAPYALGGDGEPREGVPITVRGPLSYAGPGSLGGTESALRR